VKPNRPPDTRHDPVYQGELTLETTYSRTKIYRAIITRDSNGRFRVRREKWDVPGNWISDERAMTVAASLEAARVLAEEKLKETPDGLSSSAKEGNSV
jgi:hypothetical protein